MHEEAVDRFDGDLRLVAKHVGKGGAVAALEILLEDPRLGDRRRPLLGCVELLLIRRDQRSHRGLEARIDPPRLALARHLRESPEGGRDRQQRQQQEIGDEFELEATHDFSHFPQCSRVEPSLPIPPSGDVGFGNRRRKHETYRPGSHRDAARGRRQGPDGD